MWTIVTLTALGLSVVAASVLLWLYLRTRARNRTTLGDLASERQTLQQSSIDAENALTRSRLEQEWYRDLYLNARDIVVVYRVTPDEMPSTFTDINEAACRKLEYTREELLSMTPLDVETFRRPDTRSRRGLGNVDLLSLSNAEVLGRDSPIGARTMQNRVRQILKEQQIEYEGGYVTNTGKMIPTRIIARRVDLMDEPLIACIAQDITEQRRTEMVLAQKERLLQDVLSNSPIGVAVYNAQKEIVSVNTTCLKLFGCPDVQEFQRFDLFQNEFFLPDAAKQAIQRSELARCEASLDFDEIVKRGLCVTSRTGTAHFDVAIADLGVDASYNARGHLVHVMDITQRKETEAVLIQRERQLRQAQKMEALGTLAGGIAHDFNNVLTPILGYADMGMALCKEGDRLKDFMEQILASSRRAKHLVDQILVFSRQVDGSGEPIRLTPIVKEVVKQQAASVPEGVEVQYAIKTEQDMVLASPTQIHQVLTNLFTNAAYVLRDSGGLMEVRMTSFVLGSRHRHEFPQLVTTEYLRRGDRSRFLRISVRDNGCGMDQATMDQIFDPFFSTKPSGEGTGMGLAVVHGIITSVGGAISVESAEGKGTTFHVVLPTVEKRPEFQPEASATPLPAGNECILFVDDEVPIIRMAAHMLESLGYEAVVTNESPRALEIFRQDPDRFDLVITDQVMPDMTGSELVKELLLVRPSLPVVLCTGFSEKLTPADAEETGIREFIMKPVERRDLAEAIRRALEGRTTLTDRFPTARR